jgi:hypothetical protein
MTEINIKFTYDLADDYLSQENTLKKTAEWSYIGPDKIWIFVNDETKTVTDYNFITEENNGENYPTPLDYTKVMLNCAENPLIATLLNANKYVVDQTDLPQTEIILPNGTVYTRAKNPDPYHTYESAEITYENGSWSTPWKKSWITWQDIYKARDFYVEQAELDLKNVTTLPDILKTKLTDYINTLKNLEQDWEEFHPYMVVLPDYPL